MQRFFYKTRTILFIILFTILCPAIGKCGYVNFLPMEDSMSAARNTAYATIKDIKPYRQPFYLGNQAPQKEVFDFTSWDVYAFILLAGIYIIMTRNSSRSRQNKL